MRNADISFQASRCKKVDDVNKLVNKLHLNANETEYAFKAYKRLCNCSESYRLINKKAYNVAKEIRSLLHQNISSSKLRFKIATTPGWAMLILSNAMINYEYVDKVSDDWT